MMKMTKTLFTFGLLMSLAIALQPLWGQRRGNGQVVRETRDLANFSAIDVGGAFEVYLTQGPFSVEIEADENLMAVIVTEVKNGRLHIYTDGRGINRAEKLNLYLSLPELKGLDLSGATEVVAQSTFTTPFLQIDVSGAAQLSLDLAVEELHFESSGAAEATLQGSATKALIGMSGASELKAAAMTNQLMEVHQSGASEAHVHCVGDIQASLSGGSDLRCSGNPASHRIDRSGAASVRML